MYSGELSFDEANTDKTEEELLEIAKEQIDDYLVNFGYTKEALTNDYTDQLVLEKLFNTTVESIEVTEDEVKAEYDKNVSEQGLGMEEGTVSYESLANSGETVYFTPEGVRQAQHILISIREEDSAAISQLETNGDTEGADAAREEAFAAIKDSADEAYNRAVAGEDFALLIEELNEDPGMDGTNYYYVLEDTMQFVPEFAAGLFSLNAVGDVSEPVATSFGYHIIKYFGDEPSGEINYDDVHDEIYDSMLSTKQDEYFLAEMETWKESMDIDVKYDRVLD